jgi:hypothetical protein
MFSAPVAILEKSLFHIIDIDVENAEGLSVYCPAPG